MSREPAKNASGVSSGQVGRAVPRRYGGWRRGSATKKASSRRKGSGSSHLEDSLVGQIEAAGLPSPKRQVQLVPGRKFLFDLVWPEHRLTCEVQGGEWLPVGAHTSGSGLARDCEKQALALLQGYRTLTVTGSMVKDGRALGFVEALLLSSGASCGLRMHGGRGCDA